MIRNDPYYGAQLPNPGLPEALPLGETMLWQGTPRWKSLAVRMFHVRKVLAYFAILLAWGFASRLSEGQSILTSLATPGMVLVPLALAAAGFLVLVAWLTARNALYTITSQRVVLRIGVALTVTVNIPFSKIEKADVKLGGDATGDLALTLAPDVRIAWLILWPHARPWHLSRPLPMLRAIAEPEAVARILGNALMHSAPGGAALAPLAVRAVAPVSPRPASALPV